MNELQSTNEFDYSILDDETATRIREKESTLIGIYDRYSNEVGKVLYEAQEDLAQHFKGTFEQWYKTLGFKTTNVYRYINNYKYTRELEGSSKLEELEIFNNQPKSLQNEMSKPSADPELNQKVFDGDITTHREYKEQEKKIKLQEQQINKLEQELEQERNKPPKEKIVEKEVQHPHVKDLRSDNEQLSESLRETQKELDHLIKRNEFVEKNYNDLIEERADVNEKSKRYEELSEAIKDMEGQMNDSQKQIKAQKEVYELIRESNQMLATLAPIPYLIDMEYVRKNEYALDALTKTVSKVETWLKNMNKLIDEPQIIEGVFTDE